jgi:hypothetical protein
MWKEAFAVFNLFFSASLQQPLQEHSSQNKLNRSKCPTTGSLNFTQRDELHLSTFQHTTASTCNTRTAEVLYGGKMKLTEEMKRDTRGQ